MSDTNVETLAEEDGICVSFQVKTPDVHNLVEGQEKKMEDPSDEYVAELLAKDAHASAKNYSSHGLQAFLPRRYAGLLLLY